MKTLTTFIFIFSLNSLFPYITSGIPIAIFHGIGDACTFKNTSLLLSSLQKDLNSYVECIEIGNGFITSWFRNFSLQAQEACQNIKENPHFQGNFSIIGISQGSLIGRYVIEACDIKGTVISYLSFNGPQMGLGSLPKINVDWINKMTSNVMYTSTMVRNLAPCSYYKYKFDYEMFLKKNKFLKDLNNEGSEKNMKYKERFSSLKRAMFIKGKEDTVITPRESSWFEFYDEKGEKIIPLKETSFYIDDYIGLRKLMKENRTQFIEFIGEHVMYTEEEYTIIRDFFKMVDSLYYKN